MMDYEVLLVNVIDSYGKSREALWECAGGVWQLYNQYGMYERDFTAAIISELGVQIDTIYHMRKAWDLHRSISEAIPNFERGGLSISHFYIAADYVDKRGVSWVADWLIVARDSHWSSRRLAAELQTACDNSGTSEWLSDKLRGVVSRLEKLYGNSEYAKLSADRRGVLLQAIELLRQVVE